MGLLRFYILKWELITLWKHQHHEVLLAASLTFRWTKNVPQDQQKKNNFFIWEVWYIAWTVPILPVLQGLSYTTPSSVTFSFWLVWMPLSFSELSFPAMWTFDHFLKFLIVQVLSSKLNYKFLKDKDYVLEFHHRSWHSTLWQLGNLCWMHERGTKPHYPQDLEQGQKDSPCVSSSPGASLFQNQGFLGNTLKSPLFSIRPWFSLIRDCLKPTEIHWGGYVCMCVRACCVCADEVDKRKMGDWNDFQSCPLSTINI